MDLFFDICEGIGLALAAGVLAGALSARGGAGIAVALLAAVGGAVLFALVLGQDDRTAWPGIPAGALVGAGAFVLAAGVVAGAASRSQAGGVAVGLIVAAFSALVALLAVIVPPVSLVVLLALVWLGSARRSRAARKYEGLRVLR